MIRRIVVPIFAALMVSGCATGTGLMARDGLVNRMAGVYDEALTNAELWMCRGSSVAAILRTYATSEERWEAWLTLCGYTRNVSLERPEPAEIPVEAMLR